MITLTTNENIPRVTRLKGSAKIFKTGLKRTNSIVKTNPPNKIVGNPPVTFTPGRIWDIKKIANELNNIFLKNVLI